MLVLLTGWISAISCVIFAVQQADEGVPQKNPRWGQAVEERNLGDKREQEDLDMAQYVHHYGKVEELLLVQELKEFLREKFLKK